MKNIRSITFLFFTLFLNSASAQQPPSSLALSGSTSGKPPASSTGTEGNFFLDYSTGAFFGPKTSNLWPASSLNTFASVSKPNTWSGAQTFETPQVTMVDPALAAGVNGLGPRGNLFVWSNCAGNNAAGQNCGMQIWVGNNPTGTPGSGDSIAQTIYIDNLNGRTGTWVSNLIYNQFSVAQGGGFGIAHGVELDVTAGQAVATPTSSYTIGPAAHAMEFESSANTSGMVVSPQTTLWISSATDKSATQPWWNFGVSCARVNYSCIKGENISGDAGAPFTQGFIWDASNSLDVIRDTGSHTNGIDLSGGTYSGYQIKGTNFTVDPSGNTVIAGLLTGPAGSWTTVGVLDIEGGPSGQKITFGGILAMQRSNSTGALTIFSNASNIVLTPAAAVQVTTLAGTGSRPLCVTSTGVVEVGSLSSGLITCP